MSSRSARGDTVFYIYFLEWFLRGNKYLIFLLIFHVAIERDKKSATVPLIELLMYRLIKTENSFEEEGSGLFPWCQVRNAIFFGHFHKLGIISHF
jgi:hypothetical protein